MNIKALTDGVEEYAKTNAPGLLTGLAIAGVILTSIAVFKATPKALEIMEEEKENWKNAETKEEKKDEAIIFVKKMAPVALPVICIGGMTIACMISASNVYQRRYAALIAAYNLSERTLTEYRAKAVEMIGEKKAKAISDEVAKDHIQANPPKQTEIIFSGKGQTLCYDEVSGRYFKSDIETIRQTINELNRRLISEMYLSLNEFYYELGLPQIKMGNELGWHVDSGLIDVDYSSQLTPEGEPCLVLRYTAPPVYF